MAKKVGRPSKFDPLKCEQAEKLCKLGAIDTELADFFHVSIDTICTWKNEFPEFSEALKRGKEIADSEVASKLYHRAIGYEHPEVHVSNYQGAITLTPLVKHYAPDTTACIFWLKNRRKDLWRDTQAIVGANGGPIQFQEVTDELEIARRIAYCLSEADQAIKKAKEPAHAAG